MAVAPFAVLVIEIGGDKTAVREKAQELYKTLSTNNVETIWDDRDLRPGEKFADSDLMGMPLRLVISEKLLATSEFEIKVRSTGETVMIKETELLNWIKNWLQTNK